MGHTWQEEAASRRIATDVERDAARNQHQQEIFYENAAQEHRNGTHFGDSRAEDRRGGYAKLPPKPPPTAGVSTGTVKRSSGESSDAPTWMRDANRNVVPRSKTRHAQQSWRTDMSNAYTDDRLGKRSGAVLNDSAQSNDGPDWMKAQTEYSPRPQDQPLSEKGWKTDFTKEFEGAYGRPSGSVLDDSAQSNDGPSWMELQTSRAPRKPFKEKRQGWKTDFENAKLFKGAAGRSSGAVLDDSAESGDAPRWMRAMGAKEGVKRSKYIRNASGWKTSYDEKLFDGAAGRSTGVLLDDSAQSADAPVWMKEQTARAPRKLEKQVVSGWKTDFRAIFSEKDRMGKPSGAVHADDAESGDAPDWMHVQTSLSPRGTAPNVAVKSNDLGIQGYRPVDFDKTHDGAAGLKSGIIADDSAISSDMPRHFRIPNVPLHPGPAHLRGERRSWKTGTDINDTRNKVEDTTVSAAAPEFFHVPGVPVHGEPWEGQDKYLGGVKVGASENVFNGAAGTSTGGAQDDSCVSAEMPTWAQTNDHVSIRGKSYQAKGKGKVAGKTVPERSDNSVFLQHDDGSSSARFRNKRKDDLGIRQKYPEEYPKANRGRTMRDALTKEMEKHRSKGSAESFIPSVKFQGPVHGKVYKNGPQGVGYYADVPITGGANGNQRGGVPDENFYDENATQFERDQRNQQKMQQYFAEHPEQEKRNVEIQRIRESQQYTPDHINFAHHAEVDAAYAPSTSSSRPQSNSSSTYSEHTANNKRHRPITGSKPQKFPLGRSSYSSKNRGSKVVPVPEPYPPSLTGAVSRDVADMNNLPLHMHHQYHSFSTPKHLRLHKQLKMCPPDKYIPYMKRGEKVANYKDRYVF